MQFSKRIHRDQIWALSKGSTVCKEAGCHFAENLIKEDRETAALKEARAPHYPPSTLLTAGSITKHSRRDCHRAYFSLSSEMREQYEAVKKEILARMGLSPICAAQQFAEWEFRPKLPAHAQAADLLRLAQHWLLDGNPSAEYVVERVVVDRFLRALPRTYRQAVGMRNPNTVLDVVEAVELADAAHQRESGERAPPFPRRVVQERCVPEGTVRHVHRPAAPFPRDEPMPTEVPEAAPKTWLAGCGMHQAPPRGAPQAKVKVNGKPYIALLDSGSTVSLVRPNILSSHEEAKTYLPITCVHGDTRDVPAQRVAISASPGAWTLEVGLVKDLPVPVLIGRDWPGFDRLLAATTQPANARGGRRRRRPKRTTPERAPFMSQLMADLCRLLGLKQLRTTVYHPQTDGLVERFNQTLKQMLRRVEAEDRWDWDLMLPYVLFGIRKVPQASTGFTPFELLFGRQPRGLLDVAKEGWEQQPAPHRTVVEHVKQMRDRLDRVMPLVREHLTKAQQAQQRQYNRAAQPREFQPGGRVMILVPTAAYGKTSRNPTLSRKPPQEVGGDRDQLAALAISDPVVVDTNPELAAGQKTELQHLVGQFSDVFSTRPGQTNVIEHEIRTPPGVVVRQRPYQVPEARRTAIESEIQDMLKLGVIEPSRSPWSSPIVMVPKPDGTLRFCNDFRRLNEVSEFDGYPMPRVDELLERLGRARYISTLDLTKGYWQVRLTESSKPKTAFSTPSGHWQYRTLPFGLHGAPATFQRLMDVLLRPHQAYAAAYLDDVVIHSETWEDHLTRLRRVLMELRRAGLTANPRKCHLAQFEAKYLGFTVGRGLIRPQPTKVQAVKDTPRPLTKSQGLTPFLGNTVVLTVVDQFSRVTHLIPLPKLPSAISWPPNRCGL
ncbi:hypothetical protein QQF64_001160 [Cirrhinus molitorella]|uniref:ribonuclease H n=1 Tax=Cirrhinus molitorella TaxID=172907 RepID=A0ABR3NZT6_9TELE